MSADALTLGFTVTFPDFTLSVEEALALGGVTAVFGPSGCGKSSFLRAIAGFQRPDAGRILWREQSWFDDTRRIDVPPHRRPVGFMVQQPLLFGHLSVAGNLDYAQRRRLPDAPAIARDDVIAALDIGPLLSRRPSGLSGGERQRVALARTLIGAPRLLLLDEPLTGLDRARKRAILPYLERALRDFGIPALYVSHDIEEVSRLADTTLLMAQGRIIARGPTADVLERIDLQSVTGHFEAGVLLDVTVTGHDPRLQLTTLALGPDRIVMPMVAGVAAGEALRIRVRARDVALALEPPRGVSIRNILAGNISEIIPEPETAFAEVRIDLAAGHLRARITRASLEELGLVPGTPVHALVKSVSFDRRLV